MLVYLGAAVGGFLISYAFGVLYNIQDRWTLFFAGITGAIGTAVYQILISTGASDPSASFYGALGFSLFAEVIAWIRKEPITMYTAPALIPLVPGGTIYKMMQAFLKGYLFQGLQYGLLALAIAGMLVFGMTLISSLAAIAKVLRRSYKKGMPRLRNQTLTFFSTNRVRHFHLHLHPVKILPANTPKTTDHPIQKNQEGSDSSKSSAS